jgi:type II secretion system protein N
MVYLRTLAIALGGLAWFAVVFVFSLYATFPADALAEFARWKVQEGTDQWRLAVSGIGPSGFGVRADDVTLYKRDRTATSPVVTAEHVYLSSGPWSIVNLAFGGRSTIRGSIVRQGGDLSFSTTVARADQAYKVHTATLDADELPLAALPPVGGARLKGEGGIDVHVDLAGAEGLAKSNGKVSISRGENLVIQGLDAPGTPLDGLQIGTIDVSVFDLQFDVKNGKGKVAVGTITTNLATVEVQGDFTLSDVITQSRLRLKFLVTLTDQFDQQLGITASLARGLMGEVWADGANHFALSGTVGLPRFRTEKERKAQPRTPGAVRSDPVESDDEAAAIPLAAPPVPNDSADRAARREQAISDRRARMEERRRQLQSGGAAEVKRPPPMPGMAPPVPMDEELPPGVPPEDGGPLDELGPDELGNDQEEY